jgi:integrase
MKSFESFLAKKMQEYIHFRRDLGYTVKTLKSHLLLFDRYLVKTNAHLDSLTPTFFLGFAQTIKREPASVNAVLSGIRGFFQFLARQGIADENPLQDIPLLREGLFIPFVFSETQTERLLETVRKRLRKSPKYFLKDFSIYMAILLQARCGLRISEPIRLLLSHYEPKERTIYIEKTKFKKDRLIPIPEALNRELANYLSLRNILLPYDQNPYLLYGGKKRGLSHNNIYPVFRQAVKDCGLDQPRRVIGNCIFGSPIPHSLRHSFAINSLKRIKQKGKSPQSALPVLAAYMGHIDYRYTASYLKVLDAQQRNGLVNFSISIKQII